jgi:AcrR family transcriptional regulator
MDKPREKVLQAAGEVFAQEGFQSARIPAIAKGDGTLRVA